MAGGLLGGLVSIVKPVIGRALTSLGFSVLTIKGMDMVLDAFKRDILKTLGGADSVALNLAGLAGAWVGLGYLFGACTFCLTFWTLTKMVSIVGTASAGAGGK